MRAKERSLVPQILHSDTLRSDLQKSVVTSQKKIRFTDHKTMLA